MGNKQYANWAAIKIRNIYYYGSGKCQANQSV